MTPARGWLAVAGGVVLYLLLEAGLFRTGLYQTFLAPDSYAGNFEFVVEAERTRPVSHPRQVLTIGDSRMAFRAWHANARQSELTFGNAGIASSTPRVWHYTLKAIDPAHDRYEAILFLVEDYDDEDVAEDLSRRLLDVQLMVARIGLADIPELLFSYPQWAEQREVLRKVVFKGFTYQRDLQEFLKNPRQRLAGREFKRQQWARVLGSYQGEDRTLAGLHIDWQTNKATYPESLSEQERRLIDDVLLRPAEPQTGRMGAYRREWFGRILQRYHGSRTRLLFARVPRGPIPRPASLVQKKSAVLRQLPGVTLLDENLLNELEHPDFFIDPLHLNAEGCRRLTDILTRAVREALDAPRAL